MIKILDVEDRLEIERVGRGEAGEGKGEEDQALHASSYASCRRQIANDSPRPVVARVRPGPRRNRRRAGP